MSWWAWLLLLYAVVGPVAWALCRMSAWQDAEEAQRGLVGLVAEQRERSDDRAWAGSEAVSSEVGVWYLATATSSEV